MYLREKVTSVVVPVLVSLQFTLMGVANLSAIFDLLDEIIANTDTIIGCVVLGVTIAIAVYIGAWIKKMLGSAIGGKGK